MFLKSDKAPTADIYYRIVQWRNKTAATPRLWNLVREERKQSAAVLLDAGAALGELGTFSLLNCFNSEIISLLRREHIQIKDV